MFSVKKLILLIAVLLAASPVVLFAYVPTPRETQVESPNLTPIPIGAFDASGYTELYSNTHFTYYWNENLDVLAIYDERNEYLWKTGLAVDPDQTRSAQNTACNNAKRDYNADRITFEEFETACAATVNLITGTTTGPLQANSLLFFQYFTKGAADAVFSATNIFSSYRRTLLYRVVSTLQMKNGDRSTWRFTMAASDLGVEKNLDLTIEADLTFDEDGFTISIPDSQIVGSAKPFLSAIGIAPYLGAVGGKFAIYTVTEKTDLDLGDFKRMDDQNAPLINGYSFVPDGPGALIRFRDNSVSLSRYIGAVYGDDPSQSQQNYRVQAGSFVPFKTASIPVFGIAHGINQAAFLAYASSGAEYMSVVSVPEENTYNYNNTYALFNYNFLYNKLFTLDGDNPVPSIYSDTNKFDIVMNYDFLAGDGSTDGYPASYVGMAKRYRDHLIEEEVLTPITTSPSDIGIRLDFVMADIEDSIVGMTTRVATNVSGVRRILNDVVNQGITNINSGLLGWQKGGITGGSPIRAAFDPKIGSKASYKALIREFAQQGIDISFTQDYYTINEEQMSLLRNAAKHPAGWYARVNTWEDPVGTFYYSRPLKAVEWLNRQTNVFYAIGARSISVDGITNRLITDYTDGVFSRTDALRLFKETFAKLDESGMINAVKPNKYLFAYVDRYLLMDVFSSQYLIMTDTVPFLQIVLQNTMELYAVYSNFSFYTDKDVLRMIDFNVWPSFALTESPSYVLTHTNSSDFYSTEYEVYRDLIVSIYGRVNGALKHVIGADWENRELLSAGVVRNTYSNGVQILINYTEVAVTVGSATIQPLSVVVLGGE